jgi:AcrR family transcriptional regulator
MRSPSKITPRRAPRQARSQATVEVIQEAAARVLAKESPTSFNTNRIAEVAGVSVGSLYQYFPNKTALTVSLIARAQEEISHKIEALLQEIMGLPLLEAIRRLVQLGINGQFGEPIYAAALDQEERHLPVEALLKNAEQKNAAAILRLLSLHSSQLKDPPTEATALDLMAIAKGLIEGEAARQNKPSAALEERVMQAIAGYLGLR